MRWFILFYLTLAVFCMVFVLYTILLFYFNNTSNNCLQREDLSISSENITICVERCPNNCSNAYCGVFGKCSFPVNQSLECLKNSNLKNECKQGYKKSKNGECEFIFEDGCGHGYSKTKSREKCMPICENGCQNGKCLAPNHCICDQGFQMSSTNTCDPICNGGCENGICVAPEKCYCNEGYWMSDDKSKKCEPVCEYGCLNGKCESPGICTCNIGYSISNGTIKNCEPVCEKGCKEGICIGPNKCFCSSGYKSAEFGACVPVCEPECGNGDCVEVNECECYEGFSYSFGQCVTDNVQ